MKYPGRIIRFGERDSKLVIAIQKQLVKLGIYLRIDGMFGALTRSAVKHFQALSHDINGNPLIMDGEVGPITWSELFEENTYQPSAPPDILIQKAMEYAEMEIGVMESPPYSNRGKKVEEYLKSVRLDPGNPWCAAFVYWCFNKAAESIGSVNPLYRTGSCMEHWEHATAGKIACADAKADPSLIHPGCIFIMDHGSHHGHTGLVTDVGNGFINTVEGNTNPDGSRSGIGVFTLTRKINSINLGFLDYGN